MNTVKINKADLESQSSKLSGVVSNLDADVTSMKSSLSKVTNYDGILLGDAARRVSLNLNYTYGDVKDISDSIKNYTSCVTKFDKSDFSGEIKLSEPAMSVVKFRPKPVPQNTTASLPTLSGSAGGGANPLATGTAIAIPAGLGSVHTYMGWQCITSTSSTQYKLREAAGMNFDSEGFGIINGRYVVATTTTFGKVGDYIDVVQADGSVIQCIIGDIKSQHDEGCNQWGHINGQNVVEFVVNKDTWYGSPMHCNPGTSNCHPEWNQPKTQIINRGNYFDTPAETVNSYEATAPSTSPNTTASTSIVPASSDYSYYHNNEAAGFVVTSGHPVYNMNETDYDLICSIVSAESDKSYDDALAVVSTILNRCESPAWINSHGTNPVRQATAPNQFVVYQHGSYQKYTNGNSPDTVKQAVSDAINGLRNHDYLSFRSNGSTGYSDNMITPTGNRYK